MLPLDFVNYPLYTGRMVYGNFSTYNHLLFFKNVVYLDKFNGRNIS